MPKATINNAIDKVAEQSSEIKEIVQNIDDATNSQSIISTKRIPENSRFENINDIEIWEIFKSGDESAFIYIYSKYFDDLINFGIQYTTNINIIEDCVQDLFIKLRESRSKLGIIKKSIRLYLFISLKRRLFDNKKLLNKRENIGNNLDEEFKIVLPLETHLIQKDLNNEKREMLEKAMKQLTRKQREVIYYVYYKNFSYADTREIMKINSDKTVRNLLYRALGSMRSVIKYLSIMVLPLFYFM